MYWHLTEPAIWNKNNIVSVIKLIELFAYPVKWGIVCRTSNKVTFSFMADKYHLRIIPTRHLSHQKEIYRGILSDIPWLVNVIITINHHSGDYLLHSLPWTPMFSECKLQRRIVVILARKSYTLHYGQPWSYIWYVSATDQHISYIVCYHHH